MALAELHRRRPDVRIVLFGTDKPLHAAFPYEHMGVLSPAQLARLYSEATVGLCLSLTNFSLMPKEMLACGLPCVELAGVSAESIFGADGAARPRPAAAAARSPTRSSGCSPTPRWRAPLARRQRVRRLTHLGARHRRGRSGAAPRAARARSHLGRLTDHSARQAHDGPDTVALYQAANDLRALPGAQTVLSACSPASGKKRPDPRGAEWYSHQYIGTDG